MTGESARLSPRTLRSLPQSFLGRALFTWFNPGSGTGYLFAVTNMLAIVLILFSVFSWGIIFYKLRQVRVARKQSLRFTEIANRY